MTCDIADIVNLPAVNLVFANSVYGFSGLSILIYSVVWLIIRENIESNGEKIKNNLN
jgi:hypothetical protein